MDNTYVKMYRALLEHNLLAYDNNAYIVFTKLLLKVNRHDGSYTTGRTKLAAMTNLKPSTCRDALKRLVDDEMVTVTSTAYKTTINICNWHTYQGDSNSKTLSKSPNLTSASRQLDDSRPTGSTTGSEAENNREEKAKNAKFDDRFDDSSPSASRQLDDTITRTKKENKNIDTNVSNNKALAKVPNLEINELFEYWEIATGIKIQSNMQKNRYAASNLLKKNGLDAVKRLIDGVNIAQQTEYAPKIADFTELQSKLTKLLTWGKTFNQQTKGKVVKV